MRMDNFDQFAADYKTILDDSLKLSGEDGTYFAQYKAKYIARLVGVGFSGKVLDYGCGIGLLSGAVKEYLPKATVDGYDVSSVSIEKVPAPLKQQGAFTADAKMLKADYDLIVVANVLHHIEPANRQGMIALLKSLLSPMGRLVVFEHNPLNPVTVKVVRESPLDRGVVLLPSVETKNYLSQAGLKDAKLDYIVFFPKWLAALRWSEHLLRWCPMGAQYAVIGFNKNA